MSRATMMTLPTTTTTKSHDLLSSFRNTRGLSVPVFLMPYLTDTPHHAPPTTNIAITAFSHGLLMAIAGTRLRCAVLIGRRA